MVSRGNKVREIRPGPEIVRWVAEVGRWAAILRPELPEVDPHDLHLILRNLLRPASVPRRIFLRKLAGGGYAL